MSLKNHRERLFFLFKLVRIRKGFKLFDVQKMMNFIKLQFAKIMHKKSQNNKEYAWEKEFRMNYMEETLIISFTLKTIELIILILNTSYILGMLWYILCEAIEDFYVGEWYKSNPDKFGNTFMVYFKV